MDTHRLHYRLLCPTCKKTVEECEDGCKFSWHNSHPARIPCKACTAKLATLHDKHMHTRRGPNKS